MQRLFISNFSCIKFAELETAGLVIMIGPQASGKSVISKLLYFFNDIIDRVSYFAEDDDLSSSFEEIVSGEFARWFQPGAWGNSRFEIVFEAGEFSIAIRRSGPGNRPRSAAAVHVSQALLMHFDRMRYSYRRAKEEAAHLSGEEDFNSPVYDLSLQLKRENVSRLSRQLGRAYVEDQLFIPAGRSWFTSVGKAISAFEYGGLLDPVTLTFGRRFTRMVERQRSGLRSVRASQRDLRELAVNLFGGELKFEREKEYIETEDGRKIPFGILSSGQQELLPLWLALSNYRATVDAPKAYTPRKTLIYIEEPEAHLFPSAQSLLLDYIVSLVSNPEMRRSMLITTHSPYVLSKINVLLKAGSLAASTPAKSHQLAEIVPRASWLDADQTRAYAIVNGRLHSILSDGLIDGDYLDEVSGDISRTFNKLLHLEYGDD